MQKPGTNEPNCKTQFKLINFRNSLSIAMMENLISQIRQEENTETRAIILSSDGPIFSAGHNLKELVFISYVHNNYKIDTNLFLEHRMWPSTNTKGFHCSDRTNVMHYRVSLANFSPCRRIGSGRWLPVGGTVRYCRLHRKQSLLNARVRFSMKIAT